MFESLFVTFIVFIVVILAGGISSYLVDIDKTPF